MKFIIPMLFFVSYEARADYQKCLKDKDCVVVFSQKCDIPHVANKQKAQVYLEQINELYEKMNCEKIPNVGAWKASCLKSKCQLSQKSPGAH